MPELITLNNVDSDAVNSFAALATDNATLNGTTTLGAATETVSLPTFVEGVDHATHDISQSSIFVHDTATSNFTANFTNVPTTNDRTISIALIIPQGAAGYLPTAVQIDGESQVILWQGAVAPEPSINATDIVRFTLFRSGGTWSVLGVVNKFGLV